MMTKLVEFTITRKGGTEANLIIEIDYEAGSINVPASGPLVGQANIVNFMNAIQRAAALLALEQETKKDDG